MSLGGDAPNFVMKHYHGFRCKIICVCEDRNSYDDCEKWMRKSGRVCMMELE